MPLTDAQVEWASCPQVADGAECASLEVLLDPLDERSDALTVSLARIRARVQPTRGQLWFVAGGPGDSGLQGLAGAARVRELAPDLDLLTLDHRGTGFSGRLGCEPEELPTSLSGSAIAPEEWASCMAGLAGDVELLEQLTVTGAAVDLALATSAVRQEGDEVYWWGGSYGTWLLQRALHVAPDLPAGVILDGLVPADWTLSELDAGLDGAARDLLAACAGDEACAPHFDEPPLDVAERVLAAPDPRCAELDRRAVQELTGSLLLRGEPYTTLVPSVWLRLDRCDRADRKALAHLLDALAIEDGEDLGHSPVMERHLAYAELWDHRGPDAAAYERALDGTISTVGASAALAVQAPAWPVIPPRDEWLGAWPPTAAPVLALHGGSDPMVPLSRIGGFETWLGRDGQQVVRVPYAERLALDRGGCPASMYASFLADPRTPVDTSCLAELPGWDWDGDPGFNEAVWGDPDRWGEGGGCGCGSRAGAGGVWLGWVAALACARRRSA